MAEEVEAVVQHVTQPSLDAVGAGDQNVPHDDGWAAVTDDAGVKKRTVKAGTGEVPELHSICLIHYEARQKEDGSVIADTRAEKDGSPVTVIAGRDCVQKEKGLNLAVMHMSVGEICQVVVTPEYGYGEKGSFSFPSVKPNAQIEYEIELLGVTPPQEKERKDMFFEERLEAAMRMRARGKRLFSEGDVNGALAQNSVAIEYVDDELLFQLQGFHLEQAQAVRAPLHLNVSACHLLLDQWQAAADAATAALAVTAPDNKELFAKALFRRAKARKELRQTDLAMNDLEQALKRCPNDLLVSQELAQVRKQQKAEQKAVDNLFRNKIPAPKVKYDTGESKKHSLHPASTREAGTAQMQGYTVGETWFFAMGRILLAFLMSFLRSIGLLPKATASTASMQ